MLVQTDLSQAELRVMAALSNDPWMIAALQEGAGDFFDTHMMPVCFPHIPVKSISPEYKKELRVQIKTVVYGLSFGREAAAIATELGISFKEAQSIIDNFFTTAVDLNKWREEVKRAAVDPATRDMLITPFGRKFQSEVITTKNRNNKQREALAFLPQSTASDICLTTAIRINSTIKNKYDSKIVALVHDAIIAECPSERVAVHIGEYIKEEFRKTGDAVFGGIVPFLSEYSVAENWGDMK